MIHVNILNKEFDESLVPFKIVMTIGEEFRARFEKAGLKYPADCESTIMITHQQMRKLAAGKSLGSIGDFGNLDHRVQNNHGPNFNDKLNLKFEDRDDIRTPPYRILLK